MWPGENLFLKDEEWPLVPLPFHGGTAATVKAPAAPTGHWQGLSGFQMLPSLFLTFHPGEGSPLISGES